jgi:hypothetical protein
MKRHHSLATTLALLAASVCTWASFGQEPHRLDAQRIGEVAGVKATVADDGVVRIAWARNDVPVTVDGMPLKPFAGVGAWAAF